MSITSAIGSIFSPGTRHKVGDAQAAINNTLGANSPFWQTGNLGLNTDGTQGNSDLVQAANLGATPIAANTTAMDADASKSQALAGLYANLFQNGGLAEAAAQAQGSAAIANNARGGAAGILNQIGQSQQVMDNTSQVGSQERAQNAAGSTANSYQAAQLALQKALYNMQASHAQHVDALNANAIRNALENQQIQNELNLNSEAANARSSEAGISQNVSNQDWSNTLAAAQAATTAVANPTALASSFTTPSSSASSGLNQQYDATQNLTLTSPASQLKAATVSTSPYYPGTLMNQYPVTQNAWAVPSSTMFSY